MNSLKELISSEKIYVEQLKKLIDDLILPIKKKNLMNEKQFNEVFSNIESIYQLNMQIYEEMKERSKTSNEEEMWDDLMIGEIIPRYSPFMKIYIEYLSKNENVMKNLYSIYTCGKIKKLAEENRISFYHLQSLLVLPVQRITRYPLLLQTIFKYTPPDHPDFENIEKSVQVTEAICRQINHSISLMHQNEAFSKMIQRFDESCKEQILMEDKSRKMMKEDLFFEECMEEDDFTLDKYHCFLLQEHLVIAYSESSDQQKELLFIDSMIELSSLFIISQQDPALLSLVSPSGTRTFKASNGGTSQISQWKHEIHVSIKNLLKSSPQASKERKSLKLYKEDDCWIVEKRSVCYVDREYQNHSQKIITLEDLKKIYPQMDNSFASKIVKTSCQVPKKSFFGSLKSSFNNFFDFFSNKK